MASKIHIDNQCFGYRRQLFRFNNSQTDASQLKEGQLILVLQKDERTKGFMVNSIDLTVYPPLYSCTPASVDPMSMTAINFGAKYVAELDTGREDDLVLI